MKTFLGLAVLCCLVAPAHAHHSFAMFDLEKTATLNGTVKEMQWINPHSWLQVYATDAAGKQVEWSFESVNPSGLYQRGWRASCIKPGGKITVTYNPLRDGRPGGSLVGAVLADGTRLSTARTPDPAPTKDGK
jgi:hypothetical protein